MYRRLRLQVMWLVCVCMCVLESWGVGLVIIPVHVSLFVIHTMTSSAITTRLSGELWDRDKTHTHTHKSMT